MVLIPWRSYVELSSFAQGMNQLFNRFFGEGFATLPLEKALYPPLSIDESANELVVSIDITGFSREELEVTFHRDILTIKGITGKDAQGELQRTRPLKKASSFIRRIRIYSKVREDEIRAQFKQGRLKIVLPKATKPPSTQVRIT